ncbi:MAG TPA: hypothetical protein VFP50_15390 [Anaeromyxobacteraceae bacterium]|nr:hypothetical protein [Anaeromyxobacteraceae bacterium]
MAHFETVAQVVSLAARELGLVSADITNPYASTDANVLQMCSLLTSAGREIIRERRWTQSIKEGTFTTVQGTDNYALPADFLRMIPSSAWNRTNRLPVGGPIDSEEWQYLAGRLVGIVFNVVVRKWQGRWYLFPNGAATPGGYVIAYEYMSSYWVAPTATPTTGTKDAPTLATDVLLFDTHLMSRALKRAWVRAKGLPGDAIEDDYEKALDAVCDDDAASRVQYLGRAQPLDPLLGQQNIPYSGFGS